MPVFNSNKNIVCVESYIIVWGVWRTNSVADTQQSSVMYFGCVLS